VGVGVRAAGDAAKQGEVRMIRIKTQTKAQRLGRLLIDFALG
jgi:hypothetical protein